MILNKIIIIFINFIKLKFILAIFIQKLIELNLILNLTLDNII